MNPDQLLSIVIPVYNECGTIRTVVDRVRQALPGMRKEIILVDDCSTDGTAKILRQLAAPDLKTYYHEQNLGKGAALRTGFGAAAGDIVIIQDADLEYDPNEIPKVLAPFRDPAVQVVFGSRYLKPSAGLSFWHSFFNRLFTAFGNLLIGQKITDIMTCYKAFRRPALLQLLNRLESARFGFEPEVTARVAKAGYQIVEVPISYHPRSRAEGKHMSFAGEVECLLVLIKYAIWK